MEVPVHDQMTIADAAGKFKCTIRIPYGYGPITLLAAGFGSNGKARYLGAHTQVIRAPR